MNTAQSAERTSAWHVNWPAGGVADHGTRADHGAQVAEADIADDAGDDAALDDASIVDAAIDIADEVLVDAVKLGDRAAFATLYVRHASVARGVARALSRSEHDADDLVSEAFARVFQALECGGGPRERFRPYVLMAVRNTAYDRTRRDKRISFHGDLGPFDHGVHTEDPVISAHERATALRALDSLPARWQRVLWYTEIQGLKPAAAGQLMQLSPNATAALAMRAREGLRQAYLQAQLARPALAACRYTHERLGAWTRRALATGDSVRVREHLSSCEICSALALELDDVNRGVTAGRNSTRGAAATGA